MDTPSSSGAGPGGSLLHLHRSGGSSFLRRMRSGGSGGSEAGTSLGGVSYVSTPIPDDDAFDAGADKYLLAKTYFDCREYRRAAHVLRGHVGRKAVFLRCYALYMDWVVCMGISQAIIWYLGKLFPLVAVMVIVYIINKF